MHIISVADEGLGNRAYIVDLGDSSALIIDPERDPRPYLEVLDRHGLAPRFVAETHLHADFVSGSRELTALGATLLAPSGSGLAFSHRALHDQAEVPLGGLTLRAMATPGHTPEHLAYLLLDDSHPVALFSGGTLIAGGAARTDLVSDNLTEALARDTYCSIRERLFALPDQLEVYPTHGGGSFCSTAPGDDHLTTIGRERSSNTLLAGDADEDTFVSRLVDGLGTYPPYFLELRDVNRSGPDVYGPVPPLLAPLSVTEIEAAMTDGAVLVDLRPIEEFAAGHIRGALSIAWGGQFTTWLGWLVPRTRRVVFLLTEGVDAQDVMWAAANIGFEHIEGQLAGGFAAWTAAGRDLVRTDLLGPGDVGGRQVLDVRQSSEFDSGHLPQALHVELGAVASRSDLASDTSLLVHCGHGQRAMTAASMLQRLGHDDVAVLAGPPQQLGELVPNANG